MASSLSLSISRCAGRHAADISDWVCARASSRPALRDWRAKSSGDSEGRTVFTRCDSSCCDSTALLSNPRAILTDLSRNWAVPKADDSECRAAAHDLRKSLYKRLLIRHARVG